MIWKNKLTVGLFYLAAVFTAVAQKKQPNILWILTDDQRADALQCYNREMFGTDESPLGYVESPNIDALAKEGVLFTKAYNNSPACAPSRASMQTGKYPFHNGIYGFERAHAEADFSTPTIAQSMSDIGYNTSLFGKSGFRIYQYIDGKNTWDSNGFYDVEVNYKNDLQKYGKTDFFGQVPLREEVDGKMKNNGSIQRFYFPDGSTMEHVNSRKKGEVTAKDLAQRDKIDKELDILRAYTRRQSGMIIGGVSPKPAGETLDGYILKSFQQYLNNVDKEYKTYSKKTTKGPDSSKPIFTHLSFHLPHTPVMPPKEFRDKFKGKTYKVPDFSKEELKKLPPQLLKIYQVMKVDEMKPKEKQQAIRDYYAFCAYGDYLIGQAVESFKKFSKEQGREYVILYVAGDHGWHLGEQGIEAKFAPWDHSTHDAAVVVSSDKSLYPANKVNNDFVEFVDWAPTILDAAGADLSKKKYDYLDGISLKQSLNSKERDYIVGEMNHVCGPRAYMRTKDFAFSMRTRKSNAKPKEGKLNVDIKWALQADLKNVELALYDLRVDALEQNNVAYDPNYKELAGWFRDKLGKIVLGDGRVECDWKKPNSYDISTFAKGAHDRKADIPKSIIPKI
ncbi:sulfatase-like hydrolase/transferase [Reichenbachiella versicolor]|uniref:sulfatase-like hydrolase/transferase n=1 Tax=Reichenbachiella versicolor TaxID=1821036 RepID=UPI000D6E6E71|nr:sulfatase-like hydrolase/transferase [Reichenbachiella versicolor]